MKQIPEDGIRLNPMDTLVVKSREYFELGRRYGGFIVTPVPLTWLGITNISTPLDPGFSGYLTISLTNLGGYSLTIRAFDVNLALGYAIIEEVEGESHEEVQPEPEHERPQLGNLADILATSPVHYRYRPYATRPKRTPERMHPRVDERTGRIRRMERVTV